MQEFSAIEQGFTLDAFNNTPLNIQIPNDIEKLEYFELFITNEFNCITIKLFGLPGEESAAVQSGAAAVGGVGVRGVVVLYTLLAAGAVSVCRHLLA